jgi:hypothetical protein
MGHSFRVGRHKCLICSYSGVVVDISWLCQAHDRVNQDICAALSSSSDGKFSMGSVHGISSLESYDFAPSEFMKVRS